jgi:hypothetical protein
MPLAIVVSETHRPLNPDIKITTFRFILDSTSGALVAQRMASTLGAFKLVPKRNQKTVCYAKPETATYES